MVDNATKESGKSPGTGDTTSSIIGKAQQLLAETTTSGRIKGDIQIEMPVGINFVVSTTVPMKLVIYQGHTSDTMGAALTAFLNDADKIYAAKNSKGGESEPGIANKPSESRRLVGSKNRVGKKCKILLPVRYPVTDIGGNMGTVDGSATKRKGRQSILWRIPPVVPLLSVGLLLHEFNAVAPKQDKKILEYTGDTERVAYYVPVTPAEKTFYQQGLAKMIEV